MKNLSLAFLIFVVTLSSGRMGSLNEESRAQAAAKPKIENFQQVALAHLQNQWQTERLLLKQDLKIRDMELAEKDRQILNLQANLARFEKPAGQRVVLK